MIDIKELGFTEDEISRIKFLAKETNARVTVRETKENEWYSPMEISSLKKEESPAL